MVTAGSLRAGGLFIFVKEMINIAIKLATSITYTADGSQTNFSIPFDYLRPSFVHVAVNDAEVSEGFTVSNRGIMFDTAPAKDALVKIYRKTPTSRLVSWADASILKAIDMTIAEVQQLHILEETSDWTKTNSMALNDEGTAWQGWKHRIENVADPVDAQDVVTKHYLDNEEGSFTATMNALKTKTEEAASTAETNAKQARFNAEKADSAAVGAERDAATALKSANNAKTSETNADTSKEAAQTAATNAGNFATSASQSASEAQNYRDAAKNYATNAKNYSENVNVFVPSVSTDGVLSWSNKAGLTNPPSVNIKGKDGADGGVTVDDALSDTSTNAIQNKVVKAALDNRAVLDEANTFTSPNRFDDIYMADGMSSLKWYNGSPNFVVASINSERYTGEANTAKKASKDSAGNVITDTYATKTELNSCVKTVNNVAPDASGNVNITISGGGSNITVDAELSDTSKNPVQNKVVKAALDNRAVLDEANVFTNQNLFVYGVNLQTGTAGGGTIKWYPKGNMSTMVASLSDTNYTGTADKATKDGAGNVITETYAKKSDVSNVTVDATLSSTSTNAIANKAVYSALSDKLGKTETAYAATKATQDGAGNVITETYAKKSDVSNVTVDATLSSTSTNAIANKAVYSALSDKLGKTETAYAATKATQDGAGNVIASTYAKKSDVAIDLNEKLGKLDTAVAAATATRALQDGDGNTISSTYVKTVNNTKPDSNGNVTITASGGGSSSNGVSLSAQNTWTAQQTFDIALLEFEKYVTAYDSGTSLTPIKSTAVYTATGNFTLDLTTDTYLLSNGQSQVLTVYIKSSADYALTLKGAGTVKYIGAASDLAITSTGLLLNILMMSDSSGGITSIVQASKLS